jgi:hypothetical protein
MALTKDAHCCSHACVEAAPFFAFTFLTVYLLRMPTAPRRRVLLLLLLLLFCSWWQ